MESFPDLKFNQVALLRAEKKTGHILDEGLVIAFNDTQKVYTIFDSLKDAKVFAEKIMSSNHEIEIVIYSAQQEVLFYSNI